jgi:Flp pilus assembly protein CpaB
MSVTASADTEIPLRSRVDVIQTVDGEPAVILENVLVLSTDWRPSDRDTASNDRTQTFVGTVTLQLDTNDKVITLAKARDAGAVSLRLRQPEE